MSVLTLDAVKAWLEKAEDADLIAVADILIDREYAVHPDHVETVDDGWSDEPDVDTALLDEASSRLRRREYSEALHILAGALGRDFSELEAIPLAVSPAA